MASIEKQLVDYDICYHRPPRRWICVQCILKRNIGPFKEGEKFSHAIFDYEKSTLALERRNEQLKVILRCVFNLSFELTEEFSERFRG